MSDACKFKVLTVVLIEKYIVYLFKINVFMFKRFKIKYLLTYFESFKIVIKNHPDFLKLNYIHVLIYVGLSKI